MKKKIILITVVLSILTLCLVACNNNDNDDMSQNIAKLQAQMTDIQQALELEQSTNNNLSTNLIALQSDIASLEKDLTAAENSNMQLKANLSNLREEYNVLYSNYYAWRHTEPDEGYEYSSFDDFLVELRTKGDDTSINNYYTQKYIKMNLIFNNFNSYNIAEMKVSFGAPSIKKLNKYNEPINYDITVNLNNYDYTEFISKYSLGDTITIVGCCILTSKGGGVGASELYGTNFTLDYATIIE